MEFAGNKLLVKYRYIEIIQTFKILQIIADTLWIYATYRIFKSDVKLQALKIRL